MNKFWSLCFLLVPIFGVGVFAAAPAIRHWLPVNVSADGHKIDHLFYFILYLTGAVFIATECVLFWYLWKYNGRTNAAPVKYTHGSHTLEVVWTILPAATLLFIAIYQINGWADAKMMNRHPALAGPDGILGTDDDVPQPPTAEVMGKQWDWLIRYPGKDNQLYTSDDLELMNELHIPVDEDIVIVGKSQDVLHSFFLPNFRVKQDVVPGMKQRIWFKATKTGTYDIVCAELCGARHYAMKGRMIVQSRPDFDRYVADLEKELHRTTDVPPKEK